MIEVTRYLSAATGGVRPGVVIRDHRGCEYRREPYATLTPHPTKLGHELPWYGLVSFGKVVTRGYFPSARRAYRWASSTLRSGITGGRHGHYRCER